MPYTKKDSGYTGDVGDTSHTAAAHADETREHRGRMYLKLLYSRGPLTDHEAAAALGCPLSAINSTRNAVMVYHLAERGAEKRRTQYDELAWTWRITAAGKAAVVAMLPPRDETPEPPAGTRGHDLNAPQDAGRLW